MLRRHSLEIIIITWTVNFAKVARLESVGASSKSGVIIINKSTGFSVQWKTSEQLKILFEIILH